MAKPKDELVKEVVALVVVMQDATMAVDGAAAACLGVNLTDLNCLNLVVERGPLTPGELASAADRTPAAITVVVDRLERAGLARRAADPDDRRRVLVHPTEQATLDISALWGPIEDEGVELLSAFTIDQLKSFAAFLRAGAHLQQKHAHRLRRLANSKDKQAS